jgi:hypothetical protein
MAQERHRTTSSAARTNQLALCNHIGQLVHVILSMDIAELKIDIKDSAAGAGQLSIVSPDIFPIPDANASATGAESHDMASQSSKSCSNSNHATIERSTGLGERSGSTTPTIGNHRSVSMNTTEEMPKHRPAFPSNAPWVLRDPATVVITHRQLDGDSFEPVLRAIHELNMQIRPPTIYIQQTAYRFEPAPGGTKTPTDDIIDGKRLSVVFDVKTELTKYIDSGFLLFNPSAISEYQTNRNQKFKKLSVYKYVASSKLASLCETIQEQYEGHYDKFEVRITNDEYVERFPNDDQAFWFRQNCPGSITWMAAFLFPVILPFVIFERTNHRSYDCGFVFRIKKKILDKMERDIVRVLDDLIFGPGSQAKISTAQSSAQELPHPLTKSLMDVLSAVDQVSTV